MTNRLPSDLKDRYFFIDYLRLHRFGKQNGIWKKNRNMLVKEHEYNRDSSIIARKGYKSYIQRCMKSILDWMFEGFAISKPRNRFAYEIGRRHNRVSILDTSQAEDKVKYIIQRHLVDGSNQELVSAYAAAVQSSPMITFRNQQSGLRIDLDTERSLAYGNIKILQEIRGHQEKMIEVFDSGEVYKKLIIEGLIKTVKIPVGTVIQEIGDQRIGTITDCTLSTAGRGTEIKYRVDFTDGDSGYRMREHFTVMSPAQIQITEGEDAIEVQPQVTIIPNLDRVIAYAETNFADATGINADAIFRLCRSAVVRELTSEGNAVAAVNLRGLEPTSQILSQLSGTHDIESEEDYDEDDDHDEETCYECEETVDNCCCCIDCGMYSCECEEEELEEIA